jgi:hypothetical protein
VVEDVQCGNPRLADVATFNVEFHNIAGEVCGQGPCRAKAKRGSSSVDIPAAHTRPPSLTISS